MNSSSFNKPLSLIFNHHVILKTLIVKWKVSFKSLTFVGKKLFKIVAISGSTRIGSTNTALIRLIAELAPKDRIASVEILDYRGIPVYDGDDEKDNGYPEKVMLMAEKIAAADAVYISTPEYNFSISSALKNVLDWLSRVNGNPFSNKPVAIASVSAGGSGGLRA